MKLRLIRNLWWVCHNDGNIIGGGFRDWSDCLMWIQKTRQREYNYH